ncbi:hypothetical protein RGQ29_015561 [Quercus rubra]|nr:hypothetical protein RGQ29_015561 [Quercus rubra]
MTAMRCSQSKMIASSTCCLHFTKDMIVRVYSKKPELVEAVSEAFENFQMKTYGMKAQVHATPDSKKQCRR